MSKLKIKRHRFNSSGFCVNGCGEHFENCNEECCGEHNENNLNHLFTGDDLWDADKYCEHNIINADGGGIKCTKCRGWFAY